MSDSSHIPFAPGRHGRLSDAPGLVVRACPERWLASVVARRGRAGALVAAVERAFGLELPLTPRFAHGRGVTFIWSGYGQWLVEAEAVGPDVDALLGAPLANFAAISEQTDSRVRLDLSGARVRDVFAKGLPIDLHPTRFAVGDVAVSAVAHIGIQFWQIAPQPVYRTAVMRSYFGSYWDWLAASAAEYGCMVQEHSSDA